MYYTNLIYNNLIVPLNLIIILMGAIRSFHSYMATRNRITIIIKIGNYINKSSKTTTTGYNMYKSNSITIKAEDFPNQVYSIITE